ncbi:MAG: quinone-dependent dihydroorotate dehydrogenase [Candidatus Doudnabacteria bacterium]
MNKIIKIRNSIERFLYKNILKQLFFKFDPEYVHDSVTNIGVILGKFGPGRGMTRALLGFSHPSLEQSVAGIHFKNPVGLAAGFDKNARLTRILPEVGFGFEEVGSITGEPCEGNTGQRLWRLKDSQSLVVYYGLKNDGCEAIAERMNKLKFEFPIGISIAKTNSKDTVTEAEGIQDYVKAYATFRKIGVGDYFTINISCPNTFGGEPFTDPEKLDRLLKAIRAQDPHPGKPIFLKMPAELTFETVDRIVEVSKKYDITGFICTNLAKNRSNPMIKDSFVPDVGGMSGKVVQKLSDNLISHIYKKYGREFIMIGCGGIFTAEDAYKKIKKGATLVQMITGLIFEGPQAVSSINAGLVDLMRKDGYHNISQAIGAEI